MQDFWTQDKDRRTEHIRHIRLQDDFNNNKMERMNGEIRDPEKVMRGLERKDSPILTGYQLFHNYIREICLFINGVEADSRTQKSHTFLRFLFLAFPDYRSYRIIPL
jgi:hypothetical protein